MSCEKFIITNFVFPSCSCGRLGHGARGPLVGRDGLRGLGGGVGDLHMVRMMMMIMMMMMMIIVMRWTPSGDS